MPASQIQRYIIREVLSPTLLCLVIFTLVMFMGRAVKLAELTIDKGVAPTDILVLLFTLLPTFFSISLPLAFLMGVMIGLGRMSADSEIVALKSAGIGLARISLPIFALALVFALLTGATNLWVKPWGYRVFAAKSFDIARQKATIGLQPRVFISQFNDLMLYANEIDDRRNQLQGLFIVEKTSEATSWVFADSGSIHSDAAAQTVTIRLRDGVIHRQPAAAVDDYQLIHFRHYDIQPRIDETGSSAMRTLKPKELSTGQLRESLANTGDPRKQRQLQAELHLRLTSPLAPLLFVLFGLPFSMQSHRSGRSGGFVAGLFIFLAYYFLLSAAFTLTKDAAISPWLTFWLPQLLLVGAGGYFLHRSSQEKPNLLVNLIDQTLLTLQKRARKHVDA